MSIRNLFSLSVAILIAGTLKAQDLSQKAQDFIQTLPEELKSRTMFKLDDPERFNMNYVPMRRPGPTFHDFNERQKQAAVSLMKASVSEQGYRKAREIMELEQVLFELENNPGRDHLDYHFCIFGNPASDDIWGWRFEGHHLSLNFVSTDGKIVSSTPSFMGTNPAIVHETSQKGKQVLQLETDLGFALIQSLSSQQLEAAHFSSQAPREIITGTQRKAKGLEPQGIAYTALNEGQQQVLMKLLNVYVDNYEFGFAETLKEKIDKAGVENLHFGWAGSLKPGKGHYYRIQGPMLLIEYDNVQNNANHVHTVVRDLTNDFAEDILRDHYKKEH